VTPRRPALDEAVAIVALYGRIGYVETHRVVEKMFSRV
jgi:hypothetical protein